MILTLVPPLKGLLDFLVWLFCLCVLTAECLTAARHQLACISFLSLLRRFEGVSLGPHSLSLLRGTGVSNCG